MTFLSSYHKNSFNLQWYIFLYIMTFLSTHYNTSFDISWHFFQHIIILLLIYHDISFNTLWHFIRCIISLLLTYYDISFYILSLFFLHIMTPSLSGTITWFSHARGKDTHVAWVQIAGWNPTLSRSTTSLNSVFLLD